MAKFKVPYLQYINDPNIGFYINNAWDFEINKEIGVGRMTLTERQKRICQYVLRQDEDGRFPYTTFVFSDIKKSGKTAISASIGAWFLEYAPPDTEVILCANSLDQSTRLIFKDISFHFKHTHRGKVFKDHIDMPNGSTLMIFSKNYASSAGSRHALTLWDELHGAMSEDDRRRWDELQPVPTVTHSLRLVSSYAGFYGESELLYDLYVNGVDEDECPDGKGHRIEELKDLPIYENAGQITYWNHEPTMPWQTPSYYAAAMASERPNSYLRLHENRWTSSREVFIPIEWWASAESHIQQSAEIWEGHPYRDSKIYIGIDAATKRDCTAAVGVAADSKNGKIALVFHKIWRPEKDDSLDLEDTLEPYILSVFKKFKVVDIACDPAHMYQIITRLRNKGLPVTEFSQVDSSMIQASQHLFDLLRQDNLWAYPASDLKEHLQNVMAEYTSRGVRIVKDKSNSRLANKKIDGAVALAIACHRAYEDVGKTQAAPIIVPSQLGERLSSWKTINREPAWLPYALRTED